jgi:hypothetical protein
MFGHSAKNKCSTKPWSGCGFNSAKFPRKKLRSVPFPAHARYMFSDVPPVLTTTVGAREFPSFAKEGWTRPKENAAKHPLWSGRGGCFKRPLIHSRYVWIIGGFKQPPRLRHQRKEAIFFMAQPPLLRKEGNSRAPTVFVICTALLWKTDISEPA